MHIVGYMDNSPTNRNIPDPRNWQGSGNRSVAYMFIDLGLGMELSDEQFIAEMAERREKLQVGPNDHVIGCPLCAYEDLALRDEYAPRPETSEADDEDAAAEANEDTASENADEADTASPANR